MPVIKLCVVAEFFSADSISMFLPCLFQLSECDNESQLIEQDNSLHVCVSPFKFFLSIFVGLGNVNVSASLSLWCDFLVVFFLFLLVSGLQMWTFIFECWQQYQSQLCSNWTQNYFLFYYHVNLLIPCYLFWTLVFNLVHQKSTVQPNHFDASLHTLLMYLQKYIVKYHPYYMKSVLCDNIENFRLLHF